MNKYLKIYNETNKKIKAFNFANFIIDWDLQTEAPKKANHTDEISTLSEMEYQLSTTKKYIRAIDKLFKHRYKLDEVLSHEIVCMKNDIDKLKKIPIKDYVEFNTLTNEFYKVYVEAKKTSNYELALPYYQKIIDYRRKYVNWLKTEKLNGYDILLDEFEKDVTSKEYDVFFSLIKEKIVPLIKKINKKKLNYDCSFNNKSYPINKQKEFQEYIRNVIGFDKDYTVIKESEHPFTTGCKSNDVRITNHFYEKNFTSSIFSAIHEMGHGLYELQINPELEKTMSNGGASMAMHESQSRFMENMIGRSKVFWDTHFAKLQSLFPDNLKNVTSEDMYKLVNTVKCSLIRTEADELTYSLHILIRYEIEKEIINGNINAKDIPNKWNELYKTYLGIDVPDDKNGCLQDVHWSYGEFGYFPTYALGSAYAAQIYNAMNKDVNIDASIKSGSLKEIENWLREHIHKYGSSKYSSEILFLATGEKFNPNYYVDYLIKKYSELYNIKI